jgi:hypothetical protein
VMGGERGSISRLRNDEAVSSPFCLWRARRPLTYIESGKLSPMLKVVCSCEPWNSWWLLIWARYCLYVYCSGSKKPKLCSRPPDTQAVGPGSLSAKERMTGSCIVRG